MPPRLKRVTTRRPRACPSHLLPPTSRRADVTAPLTVARTEHDVGNRHFWPSRYPLAAPSVEFDLTNHGAGRPPGQARAAAIRRLTGAS